jgi:hypothetical protein
MSWLLVGLLLTYAYRFWDCESNAEPDRGSADNQVAEAGSYARAWNRFSPTVGSVFSPVYPVVAFQPGGSVLTGFESMSEQWLAEDKRQPRKQRPYRETGHRPLDRRAGMSCHVLAGATVRKEVAVFALF